MAAAKLALPSFALPFLPPLPHFTPATRSISSHPPRLPTPARSSVTSSLSSPSPSSPSSRPRLFWHEPASPAALTQGVEAGVSRFVFRGASGAALYASCAGLAKFAPVRVGADGAFLADDTTPTGALCVCRSAEDVEALIARAEAGARGDVFVMHAAEGWRVIPVENFIAARQQGGFLAQFLVVVGSASEAETMLALLDFGADGAVLRSDDAGEIAAFGRLVTRYDVGADVGRLSVARVSGVRSVGTGDRVCVDCCSNMAEDEMLLVGNASGALFGVRSEAVANDYVESRPFRFNAGPPHAYCLTPKGRTQYLSELQSGCEVVVVRVGEDGEVEARTVIVGRCKVERRPLLLVSASVGVEGEERDVSLFMQNAETCRLGTVLSDGSHSSSSVVSLQVGDNVIIREDSSARHRGYAIEEFLVEK